MRKFSENVKKKEHGYRVKVAYYSEGEKFSLLTCGVLRRGTEKTIAKRRNEFVLCSSVKILRHERFGVRGTQAGA